MQRLFAGVILVVLSCTMVWSQEKGQASTAPKAPVVVAGSDPLTVLAPFRLSPPPFSRSSEFRHHTVSEAPPETNPEIPFVVVNGAVYVRLPAGLLMPMSGGGASGCFSADLPQRIAALDGYLLKLKSLKQDEPRH